MNPEQCDCCKKLHTIPHWVAYVATVLLFPTVCQKAVEIPLPRSRETLRGSKKPPYRIGLPNALNQQHLSISYIALKSCLTNSFVRAMSDSMELDELDASQTPIPTMPITQQASAINAGLTHRTHNLARSNAVVLALTSTYHAQGWRPPFPQTHRYPQHFHIPQLHPPVPLPSQSGSFQAVGTRQKRTRRDSSDSGGDDSADTSIATGFKRLKLDQLPGGCAPVTLPYNTYNIEYHM
jgi:hypothetical protein